MGRVPEVPFGETACFEPRRNENPAGGHEPGLAWLATLHVSRAHRRRGVASALWGAGVALAHEAGAGSLYVSATLTGSAVGFYLGRGCRLADPVHPELFAHEPEDIHLVCPLDG